MCLCVYRQDVNSEVCFDLGFVILCWSERELYFRSYLLCILLFRGVNVLG